MKPRRLLGAVLAASVAGCALPLFGGRSTPVKPAPQLAAADTVTLAPPIVQVRDFSRSSVVSVVAWESDDARVGLRSEINRNGMLVGGRRGDHVLYLTPFYVWYMGGFVHAMVEPGKPLLGGGGFSDTYNCYYGSLCTPMTTVRVRLPDSLLRAKRDSLVVTFLPASRDPWTVTLRRELIAAFLTKVDSVVAQMR
jgi:hypothetical protein